ncbi:hypothetical protein ACUOCP_06890, partial [Escherichia sp. R-CC3]
MLTRENMLNGTFVRVHEALLPANMLWDAEKIRASMNSTLEERPTGAPVWIFAYGSLMWNPVLAIEEMQRAQSGLQFPYIICIRANVSTGRCDAQR